MPRLVPLLALSCFALLRCNAALPEDPSSGEGTEEALRHNGGNTGAFLRETTPAGYGCILTRVTVPDYTADPEAMGNPWIYFGFGDEAGIDMEVGLAFQRGDGTQAKPRRYRPYMRKGSTFWFASESETVLPGQSTDLRARLVEGKIYLNKDGRAVSFTSSAGDAIDFLRLDGLARSRTHVRRVVGQATRVMNYSGTRLGTVGPVVFENTRVCDRNDAEVAFQGSVAAWSEVRGGTIYGTTVWPSRCVSRARSGAREEIWLFAESP